LTLTHSPAPTLDALTERHQAWEEEDEGGAENARFQDAGAWLLELLVAPLGRPNREATAAPGRGRCGAAENGVADWASELVASSIV